MGCVGAVLLSGPVLLLLLEGVWSQLITWDDMRVDSRILTGMDSISNFASISTPLKNLSRVLVVDQGGNGDSTTIQGAVDLVPYSNPSRVKILILPGTYREKVTLGSGKPYVSLIGRPNQASNTVITWNDKASDMYSSNGTQLGTYNTATVSVFSDYFCATEVTFENTVVAMPGDEGRQAVALRIASERAMLHRVRVVGSQDTLLDESGCHLYSECFIQGSVDFVFGNARSLYRNTVLHSVANTSGAVAAQGRSSPRERSGFSFFNCTLSGSGRVLLGRAWGDYSTVVYSYCHIQDIVARQRWGDWDLPSRRLTSMFGEFHCRGEGAYYRSTDAWWNKTFTYQQRVGGQRSDIGWEHGFDVNGTGKKVKCNYCLKVYSGGIHRLKNHLGHTHDNVEICPSVPNEVRDMFRNLLRSAAIEAENKKQRLHDIGDEEEESMLEMQRSRKGKGPLDRMFTKTNTKVQSTINQKFKKEERDSVCQQIARFFYTSAIPFNVVNNPEFAKMVDKISKFGSGLKPPSFHEVRVTFLNREVNIVKQILEEHKLEWKKTGCTIMSDGWTDRKKRTLCNFLVNSPKGSVFLKSIDAFDISKTADKIFKMLDDVVDFIGEENVVQVVSDNAANYKAAGEMLMSKRKRLFWTPCAAHCIDLMLEDFDKKLNVHSTTIENAKRITTFIYSRTLLHSWLKEFTQGRELIRPGATRFATSYLTLRSLNEQKGPLLSMFASDKWKSSRFASLAEGRSVENIVLDSRGFWNDVTTCLKASLPLVKVLRMVDSDQPAMGFIYEAMDQAKSQIKENFKDIERSFKPIWDIIDLRWESQLHRPLHAAAYYLNPHFQYSPNFKGVAGIKIGLYDCLSRMIHDPSEKVKIDLQMDDFKNAKGLFVLPTAIMTRSKKSPADWWDSYGDECPELKRFAIRVLSLTCSSSGCERNWSAFEMVHTKKRNRLAQEKLNDLVFVMYNLKLKQRREKKRDSIAQSLDLDDVQSDDEWITELEDYEMLDAINRVDDEVGEQSRETTSRGDTLGSSTFVGSNQNDNLGGLGTNAFINLFDEEGDHEIGSTNDFGSVDRDDGNYGYED